MGFCYFSLFVCGEVCRLCRVYNRSTDLCAADGQGPTRSQNNTYLPMLNPNLLIPAPIFPGPRHPLLRLSLEHKLITLILPNLPAVQNSQIPPLQILHEMCERIWSPLWIFWQVYRQKELFIVLFVHAGQWAQWSWIDGEFAVYGLYASFSTQGVIVSFWNINKILNPTNTTTNTH